MGISFYVSCSELISRLPVGKATNCTIMLYSLVFRATCTSAAMVVLPRCTACTANYMCNIPVLGAVPDVFSTGARGRTTHTCVFDNMNPETLRTLKQKRASAAFLIRLSLSHPI